MNKKEAKKRYKETFFTETFKKQFSTKRIDIIHLLINMRGDVEKADYLKGQNIFTKYRSLYSRKNCRGLAY